MKQPEDFIRDAIQLAEENVRSNHGGPFGALVVKNGKVIGKGVNTVIHDNDPTAHAEINAIREATRNLQSFQLEDCEIYTSSEPCPMCLGAIYWARPRTLYFAASYQDAAKAGFDDSLIYKEMQLQPLKRKIKGVQLLKNEAIKVFELWNASTQKKEY